MVCLFSDSIVKDLVVRTHREGILGGRDVDAENARGDSFGDSKLEQVVLGNHSRVPSEFLNQLLSEIRQWQPASVDQKDDITLIVVDIVS
jgi:serine phosphatase RsbU (regulator of sigma subunit)